VSADPSTGGRSIPKATLIITAANAAVQEATHTNQRPIAGREANRTGRLPVYVSTSADNKDDSVSRTQAGASRPDAMAATAELESSASRLPAANGSKTAATSRGSENRRSGDFSNIR
jgi:hypothetical protein